METSPMPTPVLQPYDEHNQFLESNVCPPNWVNPEPVSRYNLVVIGAGAAGLITAYGAAGVGAKVALIERNLMGGDCLNVGCVPSKALIHSANIAHEVRSSCKAGVTVDGEVVVDFPAVMERMRRLRAQISPVDSVKRLAENGIDVFLGEASFTGSDTIIVDGKTLRFQKAVIATGARAVEVPLPGLSDVGYLTNETVFSLTEQPRRLAVVGGGPIGCELAQAFQRYGSEVTIYERSSQFLRREDRDAASVLEKAFRREGVSICLDTEIKNVARSGDGIIIDHQCQGGAEQTTVDALLLAIGRAPNVEGLDLERVGVSYDARKGVEVNERLQTTNPRIYACGDICMNYKFTHVADATARIVIQNALFFGRKKYSALTVPWCTYTAPEIAHVGMNEENATVPIDTFQLEFSEIDRAIVDEEDEGFAKIHVQKGSDKIVGATIVGRGAGDLLSEVTLAMVHNIGLSKIASVIHPYPTRAEIIRKLGDSYNRTRLTPTAKKLFSTFLAWRR